MVSLVKHASPENIHVVWIDKAQKDSYYVEKRIIKEYRLQCGAEIAIAVTADYPRGKGLLIFISRALGQNMTDIKRDIGWLSMAPDTAIRDR